MLDYIVCGFGLQINSLIMIVIVVQDYKGHEVNEELLNTDVNECMKNHVFELRRKI